MSDAELTTPGSRASGRPRRTIRNLLPGVPDCSWDHDLEMTEFMAVFDATRADYERLKRDAVSKDEPTRIRMAAAADTPPELLYFLACDQNLAVRAAVAMNRACPTQVDSRLVHDADPRVRMVLARKLAELTPSLGSQEQARISQCAWSNLTELVGDALEKVRALVAELVAGMPDAPRELILRLARETCLSVSDPVLRLSPVLTEEDLLGLLACGPSEQRAHSIAHRVDLTEAVSDAIVETANTAAIGALLSNRSASIRECTLDALVSRAAERVEWHAPLVRRPSLSANSARMLCGIVAEQLVQVLIHRAELDPVLVGELKAQLEWRIGHPDQAGQVPCSDEQLLSDAHRLGASGGLNEASVIEAIRGGDIDRMNAMLAVAAGVPLAAVQRAAKLRSAKAVVSLIWRAGFSMRIAGAVQSLLCNLTPSTVLRASASGGFPLSEEEMRWQVEFVTHI